MNLILPARSEIIRGDANLGESENYSTKKG
jgi:hypothetical protein